MSLQELRQLLPVSVLILVQVDDPGGGEGGERERSI